MTKSLRSLFGVGILFSTASLAWPAESLTRDNDVSFTFNEGDILLVGVSTDNGANDSTAAAAPSVGSATRSIF